MMVQDVQKWSEHVFGGCDLGDKRLTRRLVDVGGRLAPHKGACLGVACADDPAAKEGAYRLVENERVDPEAVAEGGLKPFPHGLTFTHKSGCGPQGCMIIADGKGRAVGTE